MPELMHRLEHKAWCLLIYSCVGDPRMLFWRAKVLSSLWRHAEAVWGSGTGGLAGVKHLADVFECDLMGGWVAT